MSRKETTTSIPHKTTTGVSTVGTRHGTSTATTMATRRTSTTTTTRTTATTIKRNPTPTTTGTGTRRIGVTTGATATATRVTTTRPVVPMKAPAAKHEHIIEEPSPEPVQEEEEDEEVEEPTSVTTVTATAQEEGEETIEKMKERIARLSDALELAGVDKELAEEKAKILQEEIDAMKKSAATSASATQPRGEQEATDIGQVLAENQTMKEMLVKIRELSVKTQEEFQAKIEELELKNAELEEALATSEEGLEEKTAEVEQLKQLLDEIHEAQALVERLTIANATLSDENKELRAMVKGLEEYKAVSEAMEAEQGDELQRLRSEIRGMEDEIVEARRTIEAARDIIQQRDLLIAQLKDAVQAQKLVESADKKQGDLEEIIRDRQVIVSELNLKLHTSEAKVATLQVESTISKLSATQSDERFSLMRATLPDGILEVELGSFETKLAAERVSAKAALLKSVITGQIFPSRPPIEAVFFLEMAQGFAAIEIVSSMFSTAVSSCPADFLVKISALLPDIKAIEKPLDGLVSLAKRDQLTMSFPLSQLDVRNLSPPPPSLQSTITQPDFPHRKLQDLRQRMEAICSRLPPQATEGSATLEDSRLSSRAESLSIRCKMLSTSRDALLQLFSELKASGATEEISDKIVTMLSELSMVNLMPCGEACLSASSLMNNGIAWTESITKEATEEVFSTLEVIVGSLIESMRTAHLSVKAATSDGDKEALTAAITKMTSTLGGWSTLDAALLATATAMKNVEPLCKKGAFSLTSSSRVLPASPWKIRAEINKAQLSDCVKTSQELSTLKSELEGRTVTLATANRKLEEEKRLAESLQEKVRSLLQAQEAAETDHEREIDEMAKEFAQKTEIMRKDNEQLTAELREIKTAGFVGTSRTPSPQATAPATALGKLAMSVMSSTSPTAAAGGGGGVAASPMDLAAVKVANTEVRRLRAVQQRIEEENRRLRERLLQLNVQHMRSKAAPKIRPVVSEMSLFGPAYEAETRIAMHLAKSTVIDLKNKQAWNASRMLAIEDAQRHVARLKSALV